MRGLVLVLGTLQGPTVGDTVWVSHVISLPVGMSVRARPLEATGALEPLGPPEVVLTATSAEVRYPMVAWRPGQHLLVIPGVILVRPDGWSDTLGTARATITVTTVLPDQPGDSIAPRPPAAAVPRQIPSPAPVLVLVLLAALSLLPVVRWWRRRDPPAPLGTPPAPLPAPETIRTWAAAGELHAALDGWRARLRTTRSADDPLLARLEAAPYEPMPDEPLTRLIRDAETG
jgi:hypothetical protein